MDAYDFIESEEVREFMRSRRAVSPEQAVALILGNRIFPLGSKIEVVKALVPELPTDEDAQSNRTKVEAWLVTFFSKRLRIFIGRFGALFGTAESVELSVNSGGVEFIKQGTCRL